MRRIVSASVMGAVVVAVTCGVAWGQTCKDFPVPIYPSTTQVVCETSAGHPMAYVSSNDSVQQVTKYYENLPGWQVKRDDSAVNTPTRAVVVITKSPGYASIVINVGIGGPAADARGRRAAGERVGDGGGRRGAGRGRAGGARAGGRVADGVVVGRTTT